MNTLTDPTDHKKVYGLRQLRELHPGYTAVDATDGLNLKVTQKMAQISDQDRPDTCLIARAIDVSVDGDIQPFVFPSTTHIVNHDEKIITRYKNGSDTKALIREFDATGHVVPGTYKLYPPPPSQALELKPVGKKTAGTGTAVGSKRPARKFFRRRVATI